MNRYRLHEPIKRPLLPTEGQTWAFRLNMDATFTLVRIEPEHMQQIEGSNPPRSRFIPKMWQIQTTTTTMETLSPWITEETLLKACVCLHE